MKIDLIPPTSSTFAGGGNAASVISIDFDHLTKSSSSTEKRWYPEVAKGLLAKNKTGTRDLLEVSERYQIPMTWALCGRTVQEDAQSYESILRSRPLQEIGVHTYSHIDVSACSDSELEEDVQKCLDVMKLNARPETFVFPWNREGHFELLRRMGFKTYRGQKRMVCQPIENLGMRNIPPTYYVDKKSFREYALIKRYLDFCISWNCVFHLWLHPWSVVLDDDRGLFVRETLDPLFSYMKQKREDGTLKTCTLSELGREIG
jgi:hypothetical protein